MLRNITSLENFALRAADGDIGRVKDFYFDDQGWQLRYFLVDTGGWLQSRGVLISTDAVAGQLWADRVIPVSLTRDQVRRSPPVEINAPITREHELELRHHYGWPPYWGTALSDPAGAPAAAAEAEAEGTPPRLGGAEPDTGDPHLRSAGEVIDYHVEASDGTIGHVADLLVDDATWRIRYLVINTRNWLPGKKVVIAPGWIRRIDWSESLVCADLARAAIKASPEYDPTRPLEPEYADRLHAHYGRPHDPDWDPAHRSRESRRNFGA